MGLAALAQEILQPPGKTTRPLRISGGISGVREMSTLNRHCTAHTNTGEASVKSAMRQSRPGLTLVEIVMGLVVMMVFVAIAIPGFLAVLQRSQLDGAVRQVMSDVRAAQSRATLTAWQYRLVGYDIDSASPFRNQYRLIGRSSGAVAWPVDTVDSFTSGTQMAGEWTNVNTRYPGVRLDTSDGTNRFYVSFDPRGVAFEINSFPLNVGHESGQKTCLGVTAAGSIRIEGCP